MKNKITEAVSTRPAWGWPTIESSSPKGKRPREAIIATGAPPTVRAPLAERNAYPLLHQALATAKVAVGKRPTIVALSWPGWTLFASVELDPSPRFIGMSFWLPVARSDQSRGRRARQ